MKLNLLRRQQLQHEQEVHSHYHSEIFVKHANHAEYACGIISPPSTFTSPVESSRHSSHGHHNNIYLAMPSGFHSWSVSKYQHEILQQNDNNNKISHCNENPIDSKASSVQVIKRDTSAVVDEEGWLTGILHLPERRRQQAANKNRFNVNTVPVETRAQLKQIYVY